MFASVLLTLTLVSCATTELPFTGVRFTELQPSLTPQSPEVGRIFFYRPCHWSLVGFFNWPDVLLNGEPVGKLLARGFFYVDRPPGDYRVVSQLGPFVDKGKMSFVLEKGQTRFVRLGFVRGSHVPLIISTRAYFHWELVDQEVGLSEIQKCKYTGGETSG